MKLRHCHRRRVKEDSNEGSKASEERAAPGVE